MRAELLALRNTLNEATQARQLVKQHRRRREDDMLHQLSDAEGRALKDQLERLTLTQQRCEYPHERLVHSSRCRRDRLLDHLDFLRDKYAELARSKADVQELLISAEVGHPPPPSAGADFATGRKIGGVQGASFAES